MDEITARTKLVDRLRHDRVADEAVLDALARVDRHALLPEPVPPRLAYGDHPLPIGSGQTISQPRVVASMTDLAKVRPGDRVLDVGTGSGYQAAILAEMGAWVFSVERIVELAERARQRLDKLGYGARVRIRVADGYLGWPEEAPFQRIIVAAAPSSIPGALVEQLDVSGRLIIPVGEGQQTLRRVVRTDAGFEEESLTAVRFVPLVRGPLGGEGPGRA